MEKLQKALDKARATREQNLSQPAVRTIRAKQPQKATPSGWGDLKEITLDEDILAAKRIFTVDGGVSDAAHYDVLRTRLREELRRRDFKRIAILSPGPGAGKSTTLTNLAFSFGRLNTMHTMVFDLDLRRPTMHKLLGTSPQQDIGALISGTVESKDHLLRYGDNLAFGLNRSTVSGSSELLQSQQMHDFLDRIDAEYNPDLMLFDMPPMLVADDAQAFLRNIDGILLLVEAEKTPLSQIDKVEQRLSELTTVVGVVLNKCNFPDADESGHYGKYY